jgi:hypothetical protein
MCEKSNVDSGLVVSLMKRALVVKDLKTSKNAHLVVPQHPCYKCKEWCHGFIMDGHWWGLNETEFAGYQDQIMNAPTEECYIPG